MQSDSNSPDRIQTILGIDAAWSETNPSGVALVQKRGTDWHCIRVASSYASFVSGQLEETVNCSKVTISRIPNADFLIETATGLAGVQPDLVCIDMPMATTPIKKRRVADSCVSKMYGARWCAAHSPSAQRPGAISNKLREDLGNLGYPLATADMVAGTTRALIEVYPHPAIVEFLRLQRRLPYKVSKAHTYWPGLSTGEKRENLLVEFHRLHDALTLVFGPLELPLPAVGSSGSLASLKRFEDALDALVCCWVGVNYLGGQKQAVALGDPESAIWCPIVPTLSGSNA